MMNSTPVGMHENALVLPFLLVDVCKGKVNHIKVQPVLFPKPAFKGPLSSKVKPVTPDNHNIIGKYPFNQLKCGW